MKKTKKNRYEYLTTTPINRLIPALAIPTIISMLVTSIYNMADTFFVGKISTQATAAVGLVLPVMAIIQALGFLCGHGSGNCLSRMLGAKKNKEASEMASTGFAISIILGLMITLAGYLLLTPIASLLGASHGTMSMTKEYLKIILLGAPFTTSQFVINNQLRFQGNANQAMIGILSGAVINVALDPLFIFTFHMGVAGAALATVMSQFISFTILLIQSRQGENIRLNIKNVHINKYYILEILNGGAPSLFRQGLASVSTVLLNVIAGKYGGDAAIAGMSVVTKVAMFAGSALIGFGQGFQPVCSFNYGAKLTKRVKEGFFFCIKYSTLFLILMAVAGYIYAPDIIRFFRNDNEVVKIGAKALRFQAISFPLMGCIVLSNMLLQSIGKGVKASIMSSARNGIFLIPCIIILPPIFGLTGVEMSQMWADVFSLIMAIPMSMSEIKKMK